MKDAVILVDNHADALLSFRTVSLGYHGKVILRDIDVTLQKGMFYGIVGPNGAGKTTFIKAMMGIIKPLSGRIERNSGIHYGYVPQREMVDELFPLTVEDIVMMSRFPLLGPFKFPGRQDREAVTEALHHVGIEALRHVTFRSLSGGQKQRALIARALAGNANVLVLDEPANGMDISAEKAIMDVIKGLHKKGMTIIMITHLLNLVADCADSIMLLNHEAHIGPREEILTSEHLSAAYHIPVTVFEQGDKTVILS
jgi:ABC-type Mn2+/Zn2+ transport system ATPase subunit